MADLFDSTPETFTVREVKSLLETAEQSTKAASAKHEKIVQRRGDFFQGYGITFKSVDRLVK